MKSQERGLISVVGAKRAACAVAMLALVLFVLVLAISRWGRDPASVENDLSEVALARSLTATMSWRTLDGETAEKTFPTIEIEKIDGKGFWVAFEPEAQQCFPGICVDGEFQRLDTPLSEIGTLSLRLEVTTSTGTIVRQCDILDRTHDLAHLVIHPSNVHHVLVLTGSIGAEQSSTPVEAESIPNAEWVEAFERTRRLAWNYAAESDARSRENETIFNVATRYDQPRLIVTSEELVETEFTCTAGQNAEIADEITMPMAIIPAGKINVAEEDEPDQFVPVERPFWMGKHEVTQAQWEAVMETTPSRFRGPTHPVDQVSWNDCQEFISRLNERVGGPRFFLPTFAQWEYARQAGGPEPIQFVDGVGQATQYAWYGENEGQHTHPVGELTPNAWGLYDMLGNLHEWTSSMEKTDVEAVVPTVDFEEHLAICGGHFYSSEVAWETSLSYNFAASTANDFTFGFRVARELAENGDAAGSSEIALSGLERAPESQPPTPGVHRIHVPMQRVNVLHDRIEADGQYAAGFQVARSMWNDILEGKVLYDADPLHRPVLTASIIFSQMQQNIAQRQTKNRVLRVTSDETELVEANSRLWPAVRKQITSFLAENADWEVLVPEKPVMLYDGDEPLFEMYAWFQVHPESGRMSGRLPNGTGGGESEMHAAFPNGGIPADQLNDATEKLRERLQKQLGDAPGGKFISTNPGGGYFDRLSGMYVAAAGVIDGIAVLISDPSLADQPSEDLQKFLAVHSLEQCAVYLEQHATMYDSYAAQVAFWQGAVILPAALGGKEAMIDAANRAMKSAEKKAEKDAEAYVQGKLDEVGAFTEDERKALGDALATILSNAGVQWDPNAEQE